MTLDTGATMGLETPRRCPKVRWTLPAVGTVFALVALAMLLASILSAPIEGQQPSTPRPVSTFEPVPAPSVVPAPSAVPTASLARWGAMPPPAAAPAPPSAPAPRQKPTRAAAGPSQHGSAARSAGSPSGGGPSLTGVASYYAYVPGGAAAGPALRAALGRYWRGRSVSVCTRSGTCVSVRLSDSCQCYGTRLIDLDTRSFARLAPTWRGVLDVIVRW